MTEPAEPIRARALLLGDRISTAGLERDGVVATAPLSFKSGEVGLVALFRYGVVVLIGLSEAEEAEALAAIADRVSAREPVAEEETARIVVRPDQEEQITAAGAIQVRDAGADHLLIVADALAKSVALARDERRLAAVFD